MLLSVTFDTVEYKYRINIDLPGNGPSPGGRKSVPRIHPSLTGTLLTPFAMYHF